VTGCVLLSSFFRGEEVRDRAKELVFAVNSNNAEEALASSILLSERRGGEDVVNRAQRSNIYR